MSLIPILKSLRTDDDLRRFAVEHLNFESTSMSVLSCLSQKVRENVPSADIIARQKEFKIIHCRLTRLLKGIERPVVEQLSTYHPHNLVIFSNTVPGEFHFTHIRPVRKRKGEMELKTRPFRRIVVGPFEQLRTASERLALLRIKGDESAFEVHDKCDQAFDVEAVSREFYKDFVNHYKDFRTVIIQENKLNQDNADLYTQTIFNRFFFLYFIQKKGYLNNDRRFLIDQFENIGKRNYYVDIVLPLFKKLSIQDFTDRELENIPFLNGGLFEFDPMEERLAIPNSAFETILKGLFEHYNFTIREDTEFEKEVAIDPEMMGTIFERLILGLESKKFKEIPDPRRASGSYYTPKFIVAFMVKQSLLNYLETNIREVSQTELKPLVFNLQIENIPIGLLSQIRETLLDLKVVDPGVGSGAYPVDILLKIVEIIETIDGVTNPKAITKMNYRYDLKRKIIENCIYGVDIQERAVALANLRLWLSLIVDLEVENIQDVPPLPNLDYHIQCGDSLVSQVAGYSFDVERTVKLDATGTKLLKKFQELKTAYTELVTLEEKGGSKNKIARVKKSLLIWFLEKLRQKEERQLAAIEAQPQLFDEDEFSRQKTFDLQAPVLERIDIINDQLKDVNKITAPFNWGLDFFEIIELRGGFDIVIANPPYGVKVENTVRNEFGVQSKDSYGVFTVLGLRILRPGGTLCYIMSDTWQTIRSHKKLRNILLTETDAQTLISVPSDVFAATVNTGVYSFIKRMAPREKYDQDADNWILAADFSPLKIRQENRKLDSGDLEAAFELLIEEMDGLDETKDGYTVSSGRDFAIFAYRQKLIPRFSNHSFFIASPKLFGLMRDVGNIKNQMEAARGETPVHSVDFNGKELELVKLGDVAEVKKGIDTGNNRKFVRVRPDAPPRARRGLEVLNPRRIVPQNRISGLTSKEKYNGIKGEVCFVPFEKGATSDTQQAILAKYYFPTPYYVDWSTQAVREMRRSGTALRNPQFWFKPGITFSPAGIYAPLFRLNTPGLFSGMGSCIFCEEIDARLLLGILCSNLTRFLFRAIIQDTVSTDTGSILRFPMVRNEKYKSNIVTRVEQIVTQQKADPSYDYMTNEQVEIDRLVYQMYNLNEEDIQEVEDWFFRRYPKLARVIEGKLKAKEENEV